MVEKKPQNFQFPLYWLFGALARYKPSSKSILGKPGVVAGT